MEKTKKEFAVKLWFELDSTYADVVKAFDKKEACQLAKERAKNKYGVANSTVLYCKVKELPTCVIRSVFGRIPIKAVPSPFYDNEIIINDKRIHLPNEFCYWDINSIVIHNAGLPVIATITTNKGTFIVQNNVDGCNKRFEIIK